MVLNYKGQWATSLVGIVLFLSGLGSL
jgi:hypothetical protein